MNRSDGRGRKQHRINIIAGHSDLLIHLHDLRLVPSLDERKLPVFSDRCESQPLRLIVNGPALSGVFRLRLTSPITAMGSGDRHDRRIVKIEPAAKLGVIASIAGA
ncbi:hypothetical protein D3C84_1079470 [compost metagenome]